MIKRWVLATLIVGFFLMAFILTWVSLSQASLSPDKSLVSCETIHGSDSSKPGMVFFTTKSRAKSYTEYLLSIEPFKELKDNFNVYVIEDYRPSCKLYNGIALYCYSKEVLEKAASCPNVKYIIAAEDRPSSIRSSAYMQVVSINTASPRSVLAHELGHAIAFLAEEYNADMDPPLNSKNCQSTCSQFSDVDGCFEECSDGRHVRSIENGFMRSLSADSFGKLNERLITTKLQAVSGSATTGRAILEEECKEQTYWLFETKLENGQFKIINQEEKVGCPPFTDAGDYRYIVSGQGSELAQFEFNPTFLFTDAGDSETQIEGETYQLEEAITYLALETDVQATELQVIDSEGNSRGGGLISQDERAACKLYA